MASEPRPTAGRAGLLCVRSGEPRRQGPASTAIGDKEGKARSYIEEPVSCITLPQVEASGLAIFGGALALRLEARLRSTNVLKRSIRTPEQKLLCLEIQP
jgi:hypothetical protein